MSALTYNTIQYSPSQTDEVAVNVGVLVRDQGGGRWLSMLSPDQLERRCKAVAGMAPTTDNALLDDLRRLSRHLARLGGDEALDLTSHAPLPPLVQNPERYNNQIRISPPNAVVYGEVRETAEFLLSALAPIGKHQPKQRVVTQIRRSYESLIDRHEGLRDHTLLRPILDIGSQQSTLEFAFTSQDARMLVQAFNFDRQSGLESLQDQINSLNYFVHRARQGHATVSAKTSSRPPLPVPASVELDVVYRRPSRANTRATNLFNAVLRDWDDLLIRPVPDDEIEGSADRAAELVLT